jgi:hypothetical protein
MIRKKYNENYFEKIDTEDKAYFLGLIFADGCIVYDPIKFRYNVLITLHPKDVHILESFIKFIDGEMTVWKNKNREICQVSLSGKKIVIDLIKLGAIPNKTFKLNYPKINVKLEKHFLRGYFDGDGCIRIRTDHRDNTQLGDLRIVSGSVDMLNMINNRMYNLFETKINKLYGPKNKTYKFIGWASMSDIERIYEAFYGNTNNELFLIRKKVIFDEVIKVIENKKKYRKN